MQAYQSYCALDGTRKCCLNDLTGKKYAELHKNTGASAGGKKEKPKKEKKEAPPPKKAPKVLTTHLNHTQKPGIYTIYTLASILIKNGLISIKKKLMCNF